jgi:hypothetical protein
MTIKKIVTLPKVEMAAACNKDRPKTLAED